MIIFLLTIISALLLAILLKMPGENLSIKDIPFIKDRKDDKNMVAIREVFGKVESKEDIIKLYGQEEEE